MNAFSEFAFCFLCSSCPRPVRSLAQIQGWSSHLSSPNLERPSQAYSEVYIQSDSSSWQLIISINHHMGQSESQHTVHMRKHYYES